VIRVARRIVTSFLRAPRVNRAVRALARIRGHRLVLVYHRVGAAVRPGCEVIPSVPVDVFRLQLQTLGEVVDFVTLDELIQDEPLRPTVGHGRRPAVALTFDDDLPTHVEQALPVLRELDVPAAFFLSGRALHELGAYWFQHLEALLIAFGERRAAAHLGVTDEGVEGLVRTCEGDAQLRRRVIERSRDLTTPRILDREAIAALASAGMTIGFHTVDHDVLPELADPALEHAVSHGREHLAAAAGSPVRYFAYPHGKADTRSAAAVCRAGLEAAFTGLPRPVRRGDDPYRLGRWEPGPLGVDELLVKLAVRLHRAAPARERKYDD
jgi:peptidoglycan/xylan/chitin deacetylase (PgdA/CDA1 family)